MKPKNELCNQLKAVRTRLGISQQELATVAGVARQTIGGIEAGTYALSLPVALRVGKALGCSVEELFWLEGDLPTVTAKSAETTAPEVGKSVRVALGQIGGLWVASALTEGAAFRREMVPADGIGTWSASGDLSVELLDTPEALAQAVWVAGCAPALSLWTRSAERWHPGLRVHWFHANSTNALNRLAGGKVHIAGVHLTDAATGEQNAPFVRAALAGTPAALVNLGTREEGLIVAPGNPKNINGVADLQNKNITLINREAGAGSRMLLDDLLAGQNIGASDIAGYETLAPGHLAVAEAVQGGQADVGVSTASVATTYGLGFVPLRAVRYDLALRRESLDLPSVQQLIGTLHHRWVRSQLAVLGGYDTARTGEVTEL
ncbi:MAG: helix-turn-helix domain-containing protein [Armatimonadetes bacterium]|nr:helix-turn-helix domain-containing protein [Armatimonadota bacterium]